MANQKGVRLDYRQESTDDFMDKARAECVFTDQLYEILLAYQRGEKVLGRKCGGIPPGNVGKLNSEMTRLYNLIWSAALPLNEKAKSKKQQKQMGVIA